MSEVVRNFSECFFGYRLSVGKDELELRDRTDLHPRIFLEKKDISQPILFFTFPDWYDPISREVVTGSGEKHIIEKKYTYDEVVIAFDPKGYDLNNILKRAEAREDKDMIYKKIKPKNVEAMGRFDLDISEYSGVGAFVLSKDNKETIIYFAINYASRKKIYYYIEKNNIIFKTKNSLSSIKVRVLHDPERIPCLVDETCPFDEYKVTFKKNKGSIPNKYGSEKIFIDFGGTAEEIERNRRTYLLICEDNTLVEKKIVNQRVIDSEVICPYCHSKIKFTSAYATGMYCDGSPVKEVKLLTHAGKPHKNFIICKDEKYVPQGKKLFRLLPENIQAKRNYRIAILGKARSGKTTYLSRLFNVGGSENKVVMKSDDLEFFKFYNIKSYAPSLITNIGGAVSQTTPVFQIKNIVYYSGKNAPREAGGFFEQYIISVANKKFIAPTVEGDKAKVKTIKYPFMFKINKDAYVNVYDIAGEDVESDGPDLSLVTQGQNVSLIIVIDLSRSIEVNHNILLTAQRTYEKYKATCPIAIVLTKFDQFEEEFNSNCACLNSDYRRLFTKSINESSLIHHINTASDEIESYLLKKDIRIRETYFKGFNIKFFSVSAITYTEALYHVDNASATSEINALNFECSQKRLELPMLWILHELGEI